MNQGGLQLTYAVLSAYTKYPRGSVSAGCNTTLISEKKYGYFANDADIFQMVANGTGLVEKRTGVFARHPLAFLMEAADDICYRIVDLEDGHRVGRVSFRDTHDLLWPIIAESIGDSSVASYQSIEDHKQKIEYLRAHAINHLIHAVVEVFQQRYDEIMQGALEQDLVSLCKLNQHLEAIKKVSKAQVYSAPNVLHIEAAGFQVLGGLLELVVPTLLSGGVTDNSAEKKLWEIIPVQFRRGSTPYEKLLSATDFVSGMTDTYAVTMFKRLKGIELPTG
jgi:dGTPase